MRDLRKTFLSLMFLGFLSGCNTMSSGSEGSDGYRRVGRVAWNKEDNVNAHEVADSLMPRDAVGVFFYRSADSDTLQTSANIAINNRFQVSLQPGNFSHIYSCSGINDLSVNITGKKDNDLSSGLASHKLHAGNNYYFNVEVNDAGRSSIRNMSEQVAMQSMDDMKRQSHQISRVVPNCAPEPARIELKVLFDTDKHFVKNHYYNEIQRVVFYMKKYPKTTAVLEGHTDSRAPLAYNIALSQRRVNAVTEILVRKYGIAKNRLRAVGYGESRPVAPNKGAANMQKNRRVIAVFSYK